jgi:serine/threonine protein kinase
MDSNVEPLIHATDVSTVRVSYPNWPDEARATVKKSPGPKPQSIASLEREIQCLTALHGEVGPTLVGSTLVGKPMAEMSRIGTNDLSDVLHDFDAWGFVLLSKAFLADLVKLHDLGWVHRDIKPGNIMVSRQRNGRPIYAGLVDFGLSLKINRTQGKDKHALGGTEPYSHPTQMEKKFADFRVHPGQDMYAAGMSLAHLLLGGSTGSFGASLTSGEFSARIERTMVQIKNTTGLSTPSFTMFLTQIGEADSKLESSVPAVHEAALAALSELNNLPMKPGTKPGVPYQPFRNKRPVRHDVLIIIDGTGSMEGEIENLRTSFGEVIDKYAGDLDLRLDVWSLGDYSTHAGIPIIPLGARMRHKTFRDIAKEIKANRGQNEAEAEAYEVALQYAYLGHHASQPTAWQPRIDAHRSIILVGDSYPHGWIARKNNEWGQAIYQAFLCAEEDRDAALGERINTFQRRHPEDSGREVRKKEEKAHKNAHQNRATLDPGYGGKGQVNVPGVVFDKRPNVRRGLERCVERRKATIHAIASGANLVNQAFMKFAAMMGNGTYTHIRGGELKHALAGILTSPDPEKFHELKNDVESQDPTTKVYNAITTFVNDSTGSS